MQTQPAANTVRWASGLNALAGIWVIIAPFVLGYSVVTGVAKTNDVVVGFVVLVLAAIRFFGAYIQAWLSWINALLGLWLIIAPFVLGYSPVQAAMVNDIIMGIIIAVLATWSAVSSRGTSLH